MPAAPKAPNVNASVDEHRKHVEEFLNREEHKQPPKDRPLTTDRPDEDDKFQPKE